MKVLIDDSLHTVTELEADGTLGDELLNFGLQYCYDFDACMKQILTPSQLNKLIGTDTSRVFVLSKKKQQVLQTFMKGRA